MKLNDIDIPALLEWMEEHLAVGGHSRRHHTSASQLASQRRPRSRPAAPRPLPACPQEGIATLSSFGRYREELLAGQLAWAPMHESGGLGGGGGLEVSGAAGSAAAPACLPDPRLRGARAPPPCRCVLAGERGQAGGQQLPAAAGAAEAAGDVEGRHHPGGGLR